MNNMNKLKGFSILNVLIIVGIFVALWVGAAFYRFWERERQLEEIGERIREWEEKPTEERGKIIRNILLTKIKIEEKNKNLSELEKKLEKLKLDPQKTAIWIEELRFKFFLMGKEVTEEEIRKCCEKELEEYLEVLELKRIKEEKGKIK